MRINKEGRGTITVVLVFLIIVNAFGAYLSNNNLGVITVLSILSLGFFFFILRFFRYPNRITPVLDENAVLCPCDGKVVVIEKVFESEYFKDERIQVSVFMSPNNVHVNWLPIGGKVTYAKHHKGKYLVAWHPKSSTENERTTIVVEDDKGRSVLSRQIAGAVARRIVYYVKEGDTVKKGEEMGFIKFGSRVDLLLPLNADIKVQVDQVVEGNTTLIAQL